MRCTSECSTSVVKRLQQGVPPQGLFVQSTKGAESAGGAAFDIARGLSQVKAQLASAGEVVQTSISKNRGLEIQGEGLEGNKLRGCGSATHGRGLGKRPGEASRGIKAALIHVVTEAPPALFSAGEAAEKPHKEVAVRRGGGGPDEGVPRNRPRAGAFRDVGVVLEQGEYADKGGSRPRGRFPVTVVLGICKVSEAGEVGRVGRDVRDDGRSQMYVVDEAKSQGGVGVRANRAWLAVRRAALRRAQAQDQLLGVVIASRGLAVPKAPEVGEREGPVAVLCQHEAARGERGSSGREPHQGGGKAVELGVRGALRCDGVQGVLELSSPGSQASERCWGVYAGGNRRSAKVAIRWRVRGRRSSCGSSAMADGRGVKKVKRQGAVNACLSKDVSLHSSVNVPEGLAGGSRTAPERKAP